MSLITLTNPRSPVSEAYRTLRTNLSFYSLDNSLHTLVVTSPAPEEGAAETAANLAVTMAQSGKRTILVECDLRRPSLHTLFNLSAEPGLTNTLLGQQESVPLQQTAVENLVLLTSGAQPPNPADLLGSRRMDGLIEQLRQQADIVIFHAPPVAAVTDATVLGSKVDGVLLVIQAGKTRRDHAQKAKEILAKANVRLIGATLTNAPQDSSMGNYY
ncbi:MAG: CpsD/CapB family tyrosine-protein kinase [Chloroflexi bacterium]|jgi:capsular exopolysaccharide synthesis family protein|nr:CpsD/CapB family tyrosine-protein kinase [Chloroflexota bacterium]